MTTVLTKGKNKGSVFDECVLNVTFPQIVYRHNTREMWIEVNIYMSIYKKKQVGPIINYQGLIGNAYHLLP